MENNFEYGFEREIKLLPVFNKIFETDFDITDQFDVFDYHSREANIYIELKSRKYKYSSFPTTIIPRNKLEFADDHREDDAKFFLAFEFTDGLYYIEYTGQTHWDITSKNAFIPCDELTKASREI